MSIGVVARKEGLVKINAVKLVVILSPLNYPGT
jgi:hypothetical protein